MENGFFKGHGLGNDYLVMDPKDLTFELTPERIEKICDRNWGVGSDGILTLEASDRADFGLRIWNPDGSEAEKSGNGLRIFARYLYATGKTTKTSFSVDTPGDWFILICILMDGAMRVRRLWRWGRRRLNQGHCHVLSRWKN